jgi:hypothetical protein
LGESLLEKWKFTHLFFWKKHGKLAHGRYTTLKIFPSSTISFVDAARFFQAILDEISKE